MTRPESVKDFLFLLYIKKILILSMDFFPFPVNHTDSVTVANTVPYFLANHWTFARPSKSLEKGREAEEPFPKGGRC